MDPIRILIADDHPLFRDGMHGLLDSLAETEVVGEATTGAEAITQEAIVYSCYPEFGDALNLHWTYQEYRERANAVAKGLLALGLHKGDHIAVLAANLPEWPLLMLGAAKAGLVLVTINPVLQAAEVEYILKQGDVRALFFMARVRDYDHLTTIRALTSDSAQYVFSECRSSQASSQRTRLEVRRKVHDSKHNSIDADQPDHSEQPGSRPEGDQDAEDDRGQPSQPQ